jgi:hypothetical protein
MTTLTLKQKRFTHAAGTVVYKYSGHDYGLSRDDDLGSPGLAPHIAVTTDPEGKAPFFTVPKAWVESKQ